MKNKTGLTKCHFKMLISLRLQSQMRGHLLEIVRRVELKIWLKIHWLELMVDHLLLPRLLEKTRVYSRALMQIEGKVAVARLLML